MLIEELIRIKLTKSGKSLEDLYQEYAENMEKDNQLARERLIQQQKSLEIMDIKYSADLSDVSSDIQKLGLMLRSAELRSNLENLKKNLDMDFSKMEELMKSIEERLQ